MLGAAMIAFIAGVGLLSYRLWTGLLYFGGFGLALVLQPWFEPRLTSIDLASMRARFALAIAFDALGHRLDPEPFDLAELAVRTTALAQATSDRHQLVCDAPGSLPLTGDPLRLEQVLLNLLDNAIKYSPDGGPILIHVTAAAGHAVVSVRDFGVGIPADRRAGIFERFVQAHDGPRFPGLGLGLYLCRQIVELHGGRIEAQLPPDGGTRRVVTLSVAPPTDDGRPHPDPLPRGEGGERQLPAPTGHGSGPG